MRPSLPLSKDPIPPRDLIRAGSTPPGDCVYLPGRHSSLALHVLASTDPARFDDLLARGFRRSGVVLYVPACPSGCRECVPIRVPVDAFRPSRSQRRLLRRVGPQVTVRAVEPHHRDELQELYARHVRHVSGAVPVPDEEEFRHVFLETTVETVLLEYRTASGGRLVGFGALDLGRTSASSVYFARDPACGDLGLGTFSALWELQWCRSLGFRYYYLGYRVDGCPSMAYKSRFRPYETMDWRTGAWTRRTAPPTMPPTMPPTAPPTMPHRDDEQRGNLI